MTTTASGNQRAGEREELLEYWHAFCDADPVPENFIERMEVAGFARIRKVTRADVRNDPFAAERGIYLGGNLWELTEKGEAVFDDAKAKGTHP